MTNDDLQQQAREAALDHDRTRKGYCSHSYLEGFQNGYLAAAEPRETMIRDLKTLAESHVKEIEALRAERSTLIDSWVKYKAIKDAEIATLRARVALLEEYAALLVESERLMLPLFVSHGCRFPEDMIKRGERLRSALMVPPIPLPGAEG